MIRQKVSGVCVCLCVCVCVCVYAHFYVYAGSTCNEQMSGRLV